MALTVYHTQEGRVQQTAWAPGDSIPLSTIWLDLLSPTLDEEQAAEHFLGMLIPTREEMREIEVSNALYVEDNHLFMTATILTKFDSQEPENQAITFILSNAKLVTVRYTDPVPFRHYPAKLLREGDAATNGNFVFAGLIEAVINRAADILEIIAQKVDMIAKEVFVMPEDEKKAPTINYEKALIRIGLNGDVASKARESLTTLWRLVAYAQQNIRYCSPELKETLAAHAKDISALSDHAMFISNKLQFLLDATLGMININQNNIIKIFSIAAVLFLPPTLVASIYGMNFHHMPELDWVYGYPFALGLMILAAGLPVWYFRRKKWL